MRISPFQNLKLIDLSPMKKFMKMDLGKVYLGDDEACCIDDICDVDIGMPNGLVWTLEDVRYVLSLKRNPIYVSHLYNYIHRRFLISP